MKKIDLEKELSPKRGLWLLIIAALVLEATNCFQYFYSHHAINREAVHRAQTELQKAELEINVITAQSEMSVKNLALLAERYLQYPDSMANLTRIAVATTPNMYGAALAFEPNFYKDKGKWYEMYSCEIELGNKDSIKTEQIGSIHHNYLELEWYQNGITIDSAFWCEPYYDDAGAVNMVVSCSYPIHDKNGKVVGVALADISLTYLQRVSEYLQVYPESYYSIVSGKGNDMVTPPDTIKGRKYHIFTEFVDTTGWTMSIIIPDDVMFAKLKRVGGITTILLLLGLLLIGYIIYRAAKDTFRLFESVQKQQQIENELNIARAIQMAMLPKTFPPYPNRQDLNMYGIIIPAKEVGGDLYDFYIRENKLLFCIGDVSGKGIPASLIMAITRSLFRTLSAHEDDPAQIMMQMNNAMSEKNEQNMFVTFFLGVLDLRTGDLSYCNAGHNAPILKRKDEKPCELPQDANLPLGVLMDYTFTTQKTSLLPSDNLFLYTDGLTEAENIDKQLFGEEKVFDNINKWEDKTEAKTEVEEMQQAVDKFVGEAEQSDDLTMLSIRYLPQSKESANSHQNKEHHSLVMRNDIQQIPTLAEWLETVNLPVALQMSINLAIEEAVTNVMLYAYPDTKEGKVLVESDHEWIDDKERFVFTISDSGIPFDPTQQKEPDITLSAEERAIGGLGIHLVRQIMDEVHYKRKDNKNILTLVKNIAIK